MTANLGITPTAIVRIGNLSARRFRRARRTFGLDIEKCQLQARQDIEAFVKCEDCGLGAITHRAGPG